MRNWKGPANIQIGSKVINVSKDKFLKGRTGKIVYLVKGHSSLVHVKYGNAGPFLTRLDEIKLAK